MRKRPKLRIGGHYRIINGEIVEIDPFVTDIPDRCKLILAEIMTGKKVTFVNKPLEEE